MKPHHIKWGTLFAASLSSFMGFLNFGIVNIALSAIQKDLGASFVQLQWMMNGSLLALTSLIVTIGRLADLYGRRRTNLFGVSLFGLFSFLAGTAVSAEWIILCRVMQGVAAAAIIPSSLALVFQAFGAHEKGKAIGIWGGMTGLGTVLGPVLGGFFVSALSWRWVFYINVPFAFISILSNLLLVKESKFPWKSKKIDWKGVSLLIAGLSSLSIAFIYAPQWGWNSVSTIGLFLVACISLIVFYCSEKHSSSPTISFDLFRHRTFLGASIILFFIMFIYTAAIFLMPLYLQIVHLYTPLFTGLMLLPFTLCVAIFSPLVGYLADSMPAKRLILFGLFLFLFSTLLQAQFQEATSVFSLLLAFSLLGLGWAFARNPSTIQGISSLPEELAATSTAVLWTAQNTGGALSIATVGTLFRQIYISENTTSSFIQGYQTSMYCLAFTTCLILAITWKFPLKNASLPKGNE